MVSTNFLKKEKQKEGKKRNVIKRGSLFNRYHVLRSIKKNMDVYDMRIEKFSSMCNVLFLGMSGFIIAWHIFFLVQPHG